MYIKAAGRAGGGAHEPLTAMPFPATPPARQDFPAQRPGPEFHVYTGTRP